MTDASSCGVPLLLGALLLAPSAVAAAPAEPAIDEQNAVVRKHCAVCHTDAALNGGLSLEHFDAATAARAWRR